MVQKVQESIEKVNMRGLQVDSVRYLNTKELSEEEKANRRLDVIGGFELMDTEHRVFIIEGLGGEGKGMNCFYNENMRERKNDRKYKLLYNPEVKFKHRIYLDFNVALKKIKLRETITSIMGAANVYMRSKVPEDIYDTL